jgi:hypothetical protein
MSQPALRGFRRNRHGERPGEGGRHSASPLAAFLVACGDRSPLHGASGVRALRLTSSVPTPGRCAEPSRDRMDGGQSHVVGIGRVAQPREAPGRSLAPYSSRYRPTGAAVTNGRAECALAGIRSTPSTVDGRTLANLNQDRAGQHRAGAVMAARQSTQNPGIGNDCEPVQRSCPRGRLRHAAQRGVSQHAEWINPCDDPSTLRTIAELPFPFRPSLRRRWGPSTELWWRRARRIAAARAARSTSRS